MLVYVGYAKPRFYVDEETWIDFLNGLTRCIEKRVIGNCLISLILVEFVTLLGNNLIETSDFSCVNSHEISLIT